jgi:hypothetical protein
MSQIDADREKDIPTAFPQARNEAAPLALSWALSQEPVIDSHLLFICINLRHLRITHLRINPSAISADR